MRKHILHAAVLASCVATATAASADVKKGVSAWNRGEWANAVREWSGPAAKGDADAQFDMAQAYKLGRGVAYDPEAARQWYLKAAQQGHAQAQDNYGLSLYQDGRKAEAAPWLEKSAARDEKRAELVLGTLLYNGDGVQRDWPRAYALVSRASDQGMEQAVAARAKMDRFLTPADRASGRRMASLGAGEWATAIAATATAAPAAPGRAAPTALADASTPDSGPHAPSPVGTDAPVRLASSGAHRAGPLSPGAPARYATPSRAVVSYAPAQAPTAVDQAAPVHRASWFAPSASEGAWRIQLGAFREAGAAHALWDRLGAAFEGGHPLYGMVDGLTRLQVSGFDTRSKATRACGALASRGLPCFVVTS